MKQEPQAGATAAEAASRARPTAGFAYRRVLGLALLVLAVSCAVLFPAVRKTPFHGDESGWITSGFYYTRLALSGNVEYERWNPPRMGAWGGLNMNLGKWLLGVPLCLSFPGGERDFDGFFDFKADLEENRRRGGVPPDDVLWVARNTSAVCGVLSCLLLFAIGTLVLSEWAGLLAAGFALANPLFVENMSRAMTDSFYLGFLLCFCLALVCFSRAERKRDLLRTAAMCGLCAGLACSIKITGLPLGIAAFGLCGLLRVARRALKVSSGLRSAGLALVVALVTIYALNPYFWPIMARPSEAVPGVAGNTRPVEIRGSLDFESVGRFPRLFREWRWFMVRQEREGLGLWEGNRTIALHLSLFARHGGWPLEIFWMPVTLLLFLGGCLRRKPGEVGEAGLAVLAFFAANYLLLLGYLVLNWSRYYLPTIIAGRLILALTVVWGVGELLRRRQREVPAARPAG